MEIKNYLYILVIITIIVIVVNITVTLIKVTEFKRQIFGYATSTEGYFNITVGSYIILNLSRDNIHWGSGTINSNSSNATLYTNNDSDGTVIRGNWSGENVKGLILKNIGSLNCSIFIQTGKDAHDFFMSNSSTNEEYKIKVTNKDEGSCTGNINDWLDANKTSGGTKYCSQFDFDFSHNEIYIDVLLTIPNDANKLGEQSDDIIIIATPQD